MVKTLYPLKEKMTKKRQQLVSYIRRRTGRGSITIVKVEMKKNSKKIRGDDKEDEGEEEKQKEMNKIVSKRTEKGNEDEEENK